MIGVVYYNDFIRCYRNGVVERIDKNFKKREWRIVENNANDTYGYNTIKIGDKMIKRHRLLAYCFLGLENISGTLSGKIVIDHKSGIKIDNSVANLRITTQQGNNHNQTKAKGYYWDKKSKKWKAGIKLNGKTIYLGYYNTEAEAHQAYLDGKEKYHIAV